MAQRPAGSSHTHGSVVHGLIGYGLATGLCACHPGIDGTINHHIGQVGKSTNPHIRKLQYRRNYQPHARRQNIFGIFASDSRNISIVFLFETSVIIRILARLSQLDHDFRNFAAVVPIRLLETPGASRRETAKTGVRCRPTPLRNGRRLWKLRPCFCATRCAEGRQGAPLLEHRREPPGVRRADGAAARAVSGRDQRQPARRVVQDDRGVRRGGQRARQFALFPEDRRRRHWTAMWCMSG